MPELWWLLETACLLMIKLLASWISMQRPRGPTHAAVGACIASLVPLKENDVARLYHVPRNTRYDPETAVVEQVVLSVTPTPGVYSHIGHPHDTATADSTQPSTQVHSRPPRTICFLHRPFDLNRRSVRGGTLVLSSHISFDEVLTVGWNSALAAKLGLDVGDAARIQGYKGDPERPIGIIGRLSVARRQLLGQIWEEFGGTEFTLRGLSDEIHVIAIMNAFSEHEVYRVLETARGRGWVALDSDGRHVLYMTGQPRVAGLEAAKALGISVVCVGHRQAEYWGIRHMAVQLRKSFPSLCVREIYEEETPRPQKHKTADAMEPIGG